VAGRTKGSLDADYLGGSHRLYVTPVDFSEATRASDLPSFRDPLWSLVVFQDRRIPETVNLDIVSLAGFLFGAFGLVLAAVWFLAYRRQPRSTGKWFWPDPRKAELYRQAIHLNAIAILVFLGLMAVANPAWLLAGTAVVSLGALGMTVRVVTGPAALSSRRGWKGEFLLARTLVWFVVAAAPAIACFKFAYGFESRLLNRQAHLDLETQFKARTERVEQDVASLGLCKNDLPACDQVEAFLNERLTKPWDIDIPGESPLDPSDSLYQPARRLDMLVSYVHLPYNSIAIALKSALFRNPEVIPKGLAALVGDKGYGPKDDFPPLSIRGDRLPLTVIAITAVLSLWLLIRFSASRLFLMDLHSRTGRRATDGLLTSGNLLLVGPPGSGKSRTLERQPNISIFDVRTFGAWLNSNAPLTLPEGTTCAINHLEHRFEDASFRQNLYRLLEALVYRRKCRVWIASARDPLEQLKENGAPDLDQWRRLLQSFRLQQLGLTLKPDSEQLPEIARLAEEKTGEQKSALATHILDECSFAPALLSIARETLERLPAGNPPEWEWEDLLSGIGLAAEPFYRSIWAACSKDEKLTLRQLAKEGVVNPCNSAVLTQLMRAGLVWRDPIFRVMNESFRRFVLQGRQSEGLDALEHEGIQRPWSSVTTSMFTLCFGLIALIILTQQQLVESWIGYVPALAPAFPTLAKLFAGLRPGKSQSGAAA
jgi:hypothetical protein